MNGVAHSVLSRSTAAGRWSRIGPYYAMFPVDFAHDVIIEHSHPGAAVLDPFAGRASSIFAAAALGRSGLGIEINPVGWLFGYVKLHPAREPLVISRIHQVAELAATVDSELIDCLPDFFRCCYAPRVLRFLVAAREHLRWRTSRRDATLMAILLVHLHGKSSQSLSNQMRQGKSMSPDYCVRWWRDRELGPPDIDPVAFLLQRLEWRYAKGIPEFRGATVSLGDCIRLLPRVQRSVQSGHREPFDLLFTSPPYYSVTNYNYDQWLRLWMLGEADRPVRSRGPWQSKFSSTTKYRTLLRTVFDQCSRMMTPESTIYIRTDAREFTYETTLEALITAFPHKCLSVTPRPFVRNTQTALFGDQSEKPGEIDILLTPR